MRSSIVAAITFSLLQILDCQGGTPINRQSFFDLELLRYSAEKKNGNVMISPASIKSTLAMLLEGANGPTAAEIKTALRVSPQNDEFREELKVFLRAFEANSPTVTLQNANALFISNKLKLKKLYKAIAQGLYLAELEKVNFNNPKTAADAVNKWLDKKTHGLIPSIIDESDISPSTQMIITNALYFKAPWKNSFNIKRTERDCFFNNGFCRNVAMMSLIAKLNYAYVPTLKSHALELPYQDDRYSMILLVPQDRNAEISLFRDLPNIGLPQILQLMERIEVILRMPKFDVEYREDMVGPLQNMRISTLFSQYANLSGIFGIYESANVNSMFHSVHMKVDEAGTVAAAASTSAVVPLSNDQVRLDINQPFLFFIRDNKFEVILFEGKIEEPTEFGEASSAEGQYPQLVNQPFASHISQNQALGQTNVHPAAQNYPTPNQAVPGTTNYNQAVPQAAPTQSSFYQEILNQQAYQKKLQVQNNDQRQSTQLNLNTASPPTLRGITTRDPFKVKSYVCLFCL
ncbi:unnamed protein product [Arctia plantaginis]|uniref:Serpin domain-containing protein n=1 Tax=Arctia plantaginis TaxID=874455 RepID=A0A8S1A1T1_ARCPL|nr:unnamed protein product [Arctia plantaginis]CAB3238339.1 unnamed protein product [Arctia plantaginis]